MTSHIPFTSLSRLTNFAMMGLCFVPVFFPMRWLTLMSRSVITTPISAATFTITSLVNSSAVSATPKTRGYSPCGCTVQADRFHSSAIGLVFAARAFMSASMACTTPMSCRSSSMICFEAVATAVVTAAVTDLTRTG